MRSFCKGSLLTQRCFIDQIKTIVSDIAKSYGVERVVLFGSYVRGEDKPGSVHTPGSEMNAKEKGVILMNVDEIKNKLRPVFDAVPVYRAILFGSYARDMATDKSDVDIVIDSRGELLNINFYGVLEDITQTLGKQVDLIELSEIKPGSPIFEEIERQGVLLYDRQG